MAVDRVGLLHPGEMGAALGAVLRGQRILPGGFHRAAAEACRTR